MEVHEEQKRWSRSYCIVLVDEEPRYSQTKEFILVAQDQSLFKGN